MDRVTVIFMDMPLSVKGMVVKTFDDSGEEYYTIVLNSKLSFEEQVKAYQHELIHILGEDFESRLPLGSIERRAHA